MDSGIFHLPNNALPSSAWLNPKVEFSAAISLTLSVLTINDGARAKSDAFMSIIKRPISCKKPLMLIIY